jgi:hypothetical protein
MEMKTMAIPTQKLRVREWPNSAALIRPAGGGRLKVSGRAGGLRHRAVAASVWV